MPDWEEKALHGLYLRQTKEVRSKQSWIWFQNGDLKRETVVAKVRKTRYPDCVKKLMKVQKVKYY